MTEDRKHPLRILYLVHDVTDPAVLRRVQILCEGGADVAIAGFRRTDVIVADLCGCPVHDLGRSHDARLVSRALLVTKRFLWIDPEIAKSQDFDIVIARTLEMLVIAQRIRVTSKRTIKVIYECLDIHRLMLGRGAASIILRGLERALTRASSLLIVSSPAFVTKYFRPVQNLSTPYLLVENKVRINRVDVQMARDSVRPRSGGKRLRIGWFGMIRCRRSFGLLADLASKGNFEIVIAGRPTPAIFPDFTELVAQHEWVAYLGEYQSSDLPKLYGSIDLAWAVDLYEEGMNSDWLLPNRLYESAACGRPAIALTHTETGRYLKTHGVGLVREDLADIRESLLCLSEREMDDLSAAVRRVGIEAFIQTRTDSEQLVQTLSRVTDGAMTEEASPKYASR